MKVLTARQIVEIRRIEGLIIIAARNGNLKEVFSGYIEISKINS